MFRLLLTTAFIVALPALCANATTIHVPADQPTIAAGLTAASAGDTVEVACGTYLEYDLAISSGVVLRSATGLPDCVAIDAGGLGRVLDASNTAAQMALIGLTFRNGAAPWGAGLQCISSTIRVVDCDFVENIAQLAGGGVYCDEASPTFERCRFLENRATETFARGGGEGGGVYMENSFEPEFIDCVWDGNDAGTSGSGGGMSTNNPSTTTLVRCIFRENVAARGGGYAADEGVSEITDCLFQRNRVSSEGGAIHGNGNDVDLQVRGTLLHANEANRGSAVYTSNLASVLFESCTVVGNVGAIDQGTIFSASGAVALDRTIISGNGPDPSVNFCQPFAVTVVCSDVFGNDGGDWVNCLSGLEGQDGNFSLDPLFCDFDAGDFTLQSNSPCAPPGFTGCGLVGALPVACDPTSIRPETWGRIKSSFHSATRD